MVTALGGFGLLQNLPASIILVIIGIILICHGFYDIFLKPYMFLEKRLTKWLLTRNWKVQIEKRPGFYFILNAEDDSHREVVISRDNCDKGVLAFSAKIFLHKEWIPKLNSLTDIQKRQLIEDIKVFFATKDMGYGGASWPLDKLTVQHALPLDTNLSEHLVDLKAKEITNSIIGVHSIIRKVIIPIV